MSTDAVVIWGEVLWDRFPDGDQLGGAPANVAWHLGMAGGWPQLVSRVGDDDDGRRAIARLSEHVDTSLVQIDPERATGEVTVTVEHGEPRYKLHDGRAWQRIECTPAVIRALGEAGVFVFGTLAQRSVEGLASWRQAIAAASHCTKVCDLNLRPGDEYRIAVGDALRAADIIKLNDRELGALREWLGWPDPVARLREHAKLVAVTHGAAGSTLYSEHGVLEIAGVAAPRAGDNVGCGDAYLAILIYGLTSGWDLQGSARAASRWASAVAGVRGATPVFSDDEIAALLEAP
ncbi:MAG TPA: PfkB family carbohydrate kinase [Kofleriaceae bacterium]|nr:PfkB family carbohydrate kinase [Kofleriaceae bacterium]